MPLELRTERMTGALHGRRPAAMQPGQDAPAGPVVEYLRASIRAVWSLLKV